MKLFKIALAFLVLLVNLVIAQPSWADRPKLTQSPEYTEVTQALNNLLNPQENSNEANYTAEKIQQKIGAIQLQKYILETAAGWGQCRNETGKTLAVYAHKPKKSNSEVSTLYYLGDGKVTDNDWNCDGVYLPSGVQVAGLAFGNTQGQELTEPIALKMVSGTQLVAKTNPETGAIELNVPPTQVFTTGEGNWAIPALSSADIEAQTPNAPIDD
jgi:hypothetical protein